MLRLIEEKYEREKAHLENEKMCSLEQAFSDKEKRRIEDQFDIMMNSLSDRYEKVRNRQLEQASINLERRKMKKRAALERQLRSEFMHEVDVIRNEVNSAMTSEVVQSHDDASRSLESSVIRAEIEQSAFRSKMDKFRTVALQALQNSRAEHVSILFAC